MTTKKEKIISKALEIIKNHSDGIRYSKLMEKIKEELPDMQHETIRATVVGPLRKHPDIYQPARGLFRHATFKEVDVSRVEREIPPTVEKMEEDFYEPFANWLVNELEECTKAIPLGGNRFRDKWGTPDVIGIKKSMPSDIIKFESVIVSAEIKTDTSGLITAFGQVCAYKNFSHKVYIVIPKNSSEEDKSRIESLCLIFSIGLIFFDSTNTENPQFEIRVRPIKHEPDSFYVNKYMKLIENELFG